MTTLSAHDAQKFATKWARARDEKQHSQRFWQDFFASVCKVPDTLVAGINFEYAVHNTDTGRTEWADVLWPGILLVEQKSAGKSLEAAETQARRYLQYLGDRERPNRYMIVCDFQRFWVIDILLNRTKKFTLAELPEAENLRAIEQILDRHFEGGSREQTAADAKAAELMGHLYTEFEAEGYQGAELSRFLVRVLFLLFGDDTNLWDSGRAPLFQKFVENTPTDTLGDRLNTLFRALDTPRNERQGHLPNDIAQFPYVNGHLFRDDRPPAFFFNDRMRQALIRACAYDWSTISPAIFGSMFQTVKSKKDRHDLGEHYTSEANILKVIGPLFLDEYMTRVTNGWNNVKTLEGIRADLRKNAYLDPACGCGNFLVVAYRHLRALELKIMLRVRDLKGTDTQRELSADIGVNVTLDQFHGIELEDWPAQIATVAMYLAERQANLDMDRALGAAPDQLPLHETAHIVCGNAIYTDWASTLGHTLPSHTFIMGNPPFNGARKITAGSAQALDKTHVFGEKSKAGDLDYVACWFRLAADLVKAGATAAFVSSNSITQGQQPPALWPQLYERGIHIAFAHRTFKWSNDAPNAAAVFCIIVGLRNSAEGSVSLWDYATPSSAPVLSTVPRVNAYLLAAPEVLVGARRNHLQSWAPRMQSGNQPIDGGYLSNISPEEAERIRVSDPIAGKYLRRIVGSDEVISDIERWCLWLVGASPSDIRQSPEIRTRAAKVKAFRAASKRAATRKAADWPTEFAAITATEERYLIVPRHSSENRAYIPIKWASSDQLITNDAVMLISKADKFVFGVLESRPFTVWTHAVSGRLKDDPRISNTITYNNFPFPERDEKHTTKVEAAAQGVLDARDEFPDASLADLYDVNAMPSTLRKAHRKLDSAVLAAYGLSPQVGESRILECLFDEYARLTADSK